MAVLTVAQRKKERDIRQQFLVDFNCTSNHLEGNTLTYGQTKLLLLFGNIMGNTEMQDYIDGYI